MSKWPCKANQLENWWCTKQNDSCRAANSFVVGDAQILKYDHFQFCRTVDAQKDLHIYCNIIILKYDHFEFCWTGDGQHVDKDERPRRHQQTELEDQLCVSCSISCSIT